jgi:hypothetical protein
MNRAAVIIIVLLLIANFWLAASLVRIENERYALSLGLCRSQTTQDLIDQPRCLEAIETRTSPIYHLLFALGIE